MQDILQEYANLKLQEKAIQAELELLKEAVFVSVETQGGNVINDMGEFFISSKKSYDYSAPVTRLMEDAKIAQLNDVKAGTAKEKVTKFVAFKINKI